MAWLKVDGTAVKVEAETGASERSTVYIGQQRRAIDGTMRESVVDRKREWSFRTALLTTSEKTTLEGKLEGTPPVSCSGDALGGSVSCHVADYEASRVPTLSAYWRVSFRLLEA